MIVNGRTDARVNAAVQRTSRRGSGGPTSTASPRTSDRRRGARRSIARVPAVDILVNNVGIFEPKPFEDIPDADWLRFFETNVLSGVRLARHYLPGMRERNWGRVVFVSSESALQIPTEMIHYGMTKTAQLAVARGLAETLAGTGVTVNSVLPGPTASEGVGTFVADLATAEGIGRRDRRARVLRHSAALVASSSASPLPTRSRR